MVNKVQLRRGTDAERGTVVLDSGEPGWTTDTKELYVGDGVTYGGILVTGGGGGGGGGTLCALSDVNCAGTVNGKALTYQNGTWVSRGTVVVEQIPSLPTSRITTGTFVADRIPTIENLKGTVPDGKIPDLESLSYGAAFAVGQIPSLPASKTTTGTFNLNRIPSVDDARIPNLETLSYGAAFATAQIPGVGAYKISAGTLNADRVPILPTARYGSAVLVSGTRSLTGDFDFAKHQAKAIALESLGSAPASPATAQMYYNTGDNKIYVYIA